MTEMRIMTELRIKTREDLHQHLLALPPLSYGCTHSTCLIGRACEAVYGRASDSFESSGYPLDIARAVANWNDVMPYVGRRLLATTLPHPSEVAPLTMKQTVAMALWAVKRARTGLVRNTEDLVRNREDLATIDAGIAKVSAWLDQQLATYGDGAGWPPLHELLDAISYNGVTTRELGEYSIGYAIQDVSERNTDDAATWLTDYFAARDAIIAHYPEEAARVEHSG